MAVTVRVRATSGAEKTLSLPDPTITTPAAGFPDASNTGPQGTLTPWTGSLNFGNGQLIENKEFLTNQPLTVSGSNVTFRNCRMRFTGPLQTPGSPYWALIVNNGSGNTFENCEIDGQSKIDRAVSGGSNVTIRRCHIHHHGNAAETGTPLLVEDCYIHDIWEPPGVEWHADGVQVWMGEDNVTVRHNTIICKIPATSAINIQGTSSNPNLNVWIVNNLLAGGGFCIYTGYGPGYHVIDNHFSTQVYPKVGQWGVWANSVQGTIRSGNVIHETGAPV